eukprot:TRINITY_DN51346_c0_g1_i1.p1 TRINITY_DN51346_c0_g1~~TRINITY_DN51346_c0_g1_i1.p1  ORF type:complete len:159 (+),score=16.74 TRINITY_DN51346_c0_g1_i1:39-479(+)
MGDAVSTLTKGHEESHARWHRYYTNCFCVGCSCAKNAWEPAVATDVRCCCLEGSLRLDPRLCQDNCAARMGVKAGPLVLDVKNPLWDRDELVVVADKRLFPTKRQSWTSRGLNVPRSEAGQLREVDQSTAALNGGDAQASSETPLE